MKTTTISYDLAKIGHNAITIEYTLSMNKIIVVKISTCLKLKFALKPLQFIEINHEWLRMTRKNGNVANHDPNCHNVNGAKRPL